jgi:hypothetical protein
MKQTITQAVGNADPKVIQMVELINEEGQELAARHNWQVLTQESTFTTVATESQGLITTIAGVDFNFVVNETVWNRSRQRPLFGPLSASQWQTVKAQFAQSPWGQYRIRGNTFLIYPVPVAGDSIYFEWCTKYWCTDTTGVTGRSAMTVDTDIGKLDERLLTLGGIWRWKKAQKLDFEGDQEKYEIAVNDAIARDGSKPILSLGGGGTDFFPGYLVRAGNYNVP